MSEAVRVGVIDSGVNLAHPHIGVIAGGISIAIDGTRHEGFADLLGHGTAVMAAIQEKAPRAQYFAVRIFESALKTSADALQSALDWCLTNRMDVINLSLGTVNPAYEEMFQAAVTRASEQGVVIVAASETNGQPCFPGCLSGVFAVEAEPECPRDQCRVILANGRILIRASGYPRPVPGVPPEFNLQGVSFAVANASGLVVRARDSAGHDVHRILEALKPA
jgi:subtilisin family serine protease